MKKEKQIIILEVVAHRYTIDAVDGRIFCSARAVGHTRETNDPHRVWGSKLKSGYLQIRLYPGGDQTAIQVYWHDLAWLMIHGKYDESKRVAFKDGNKENRVPGNLELVDRKKKDKSEEIRTIRGHEIDSIRFMVKGGEKNVAKIARDLNLNRCSVRRVIHKINAGEKLEFEGRYDLKNKK